MVKWVKIFKTEKALEIQQAGPTEACGKVKKIAKSLKTPLLLSNVIDANHQNSCLFTNKGYFSFTFMGFNWCAS